MASLRKRFSKWALGGDESPKRPLSMDENRVSLDSGYQSMLHQTRTSLASPFPPQVDDESPKSSPKTLHKALSTTFGYLASTVRQGANAFHQESSDKENSLAEWTGVETPTDTPKKLRHRSSVFSSIRNRRGLQASKTSEAVVEVDHSLTLPVTPTRVTDERAPMLDVDLPGSSLHDESSEQTVNVASSSGVSGAKVLWPSPTRVAAGLDDSFIDRDDLTSRVRNFVESELSSPTIRMIRSPDLDDNEHDAEIGSSAPQSDKDAVSPAHAKDIFTKSSILMTPPEYAQPPQISKVRFGDQNGSPVQVIPQARDSLNVDLKPESNLGGDRLPSDVYEADTEMSPGTAPSMGSRTVWEHNRADRDRRYLAAVKGSNQSDGDSPAQIPQPQSPKLFPVHDQMEELTSRLSSADGIACCGGTIEGASDKKSPPTDAIGYVVEAANRLSGFELSDEEDNAWPFHDGCHSSSLMPSIFLTVDDIMASRDQRAKAHQHDCHSSESDTDISSNSPSRKSAIPSSEDAYEAGLRAAGLFVRSYSARSSITLFGKPAVDAPNRAEDVGATSDEDIQSRMPTPISRSRSASSISIVTNESCAITTSSPSCNALPPFPILHVRSTPAGRSSSTWIDVEEAHSGEIPVTGPANKGLNRRSLVVENDEVPTLDLKPMKTGPDIASLEALTETTAQLRVESQTRTPRKAFIAARLPKFGSPSPSPQSKRSLRRRKRAIARMPFSETAGNKKKTIEAPRKISVPLFSVKNFESPNKDPTPYAGHELDAISFEKSKENACDSLAENSESTKELNDFIEKNGLVDQDGNTKVNAVTWGSAHDSTLEAQSHVKGELLEPQNPAFDVFWEDSKSDELKGQGDEMANVDADKKRRTEKPRWRVPAKLVD